MIKKIALVFCLCFLSACSTTHEKGSYTGLVYRVQSGDTLYSIAWETGKTVKGLRSYNSLKSSSEIKSGQILFLTHSVKVSKYKVRAGDTVSGIAKKTGTRSQDVIVYNKLNSRGVIHKGQSLFLPRKVASGRYVVKSGDTLSGIAVKTGSSVSYLMLRNNINKKGHIYVGQTLYLSGKLAYKPSDKVKKKSNQSQRPPKKLVVKNNKIKSWRWPTDGKLIKKFKHSATSLQGINIVNQRGTPIKAAASGQVVYAGGGLRGYGNLIIIKHNNDYLSAYAHNEKLLVKERQKVKKGDEIALMGDTGTNSVSLHFEIRYKGKPVDPLRYLPKK
ncbi:MAG TPA: LysM peptidoglycan-binding domain-containing protein [Psychromonas hadalis]|nr:LysM peptidoglycan-binding domain-containing protein [Psychromonas hadalis]